MGGRTTYDGNTALCTKVHRAVKMIESRQSYSKESLVQFFWPTLYILIIFPGLRMLRTFGGVFGSGLLTLSGYVKVSLAVDRTVDVSW